MNRWKVIATFVNGVLSRGQIAIFANFDLYFLLDICLQLLGKK